MSRDNWVILRGGPKDGWVYDLDFIPPELKPDERGVMDIGEVTYSPTKDVEIHADGDPILIYRCDSDPDI